MAIGESLVHTQTIGGVVVIRIIHNSVVHDRLIEHLGHEIQALFDDGACQKFILDFSNVDFVNSHSLGMLFKVGKRAKEAKLKLRLCSINAAILDVFKITKMDSFFDIKPTLEAALKGM